MTEITTLPKWKSHKEVSAAKVIESKYSGIAERLNAHDSGLRWKLDCGLVIIVSLDLAARPAGRDVVGGYYVRYADGFESWSPAQAFEEGYTRIE